jgi:hypothetical protein
MFCIPATQRIHELAQVIELAKSNDVKITEDFFQEMFGIIFADRKADMADKAFDGIGGLVNSVIGAIGKSKNDSESNFSFEKMFSNDGEDINHG